MFFKARHLGASSLHYKFQGLTPLMWSMNPLLFREKIQIVRSLLIVGCHTGWCGGCSGDFISASPTHLTVAISPFVVRELFRLFSGLSEGIVPHVVADSVYSWEEVSSGSSWTILDYVPGLILNYSKFLFTIENTFGEQKSYRILFELHFVAIFLHIWTLVSSIKF